MITDKEINDYASHRWEQSQGEFSVNDFKEGVDLIKSKFYSEEEIKNILSKAIIEYNNKDLSKYSNWYLESFLVWFEQNKKK